MRKITGTVAAVLAAVGSAVCGADVPFWNTNKFWSVEGETRTPVEFTTGELTLAGQTLEERVEGDFADSPYFKLRQSVILAGRVTAAASAVPSRIKGLWIAPCQMNACDPLIIDVQEGAELILDGKLTDGMDFTEGHPWLGGFTKTGAGTLTIKGRGNLHGVVTVAAGTLKLDAGASLGAANVIVNPQAARLLLADGADMNAVRSVNTVQPPDVVWTAEIRLDASVFAQLDSNTVDADPWRTWGPSRSHIQNLGTLPLTLPAHGSRPLVIDKNAFGTNRPSFRMEKTAGSTEGCHFSINNWQDYNLNGKDITCFTVRRVHSEADVSTAGCNGRWCPSFMLTEWTRRPDQSSTADPYGIAVQGQNNKTDANGTTWYDSTRFDYWKPMVGHMSVNPLDLVNPHIEWMCGASKDGETTGTFKCGILFPDPAKDKTGIANNVTGLPATVTPRAFVIHGGVVYNTGLSGNNVFNTLHLGELLVFFRKLSDTEIADVQNYLRHKWFGHDTTWTVSETPVEVASGAVASASLQTVETRKTGAGTLAAVDAAALAARKVTLAAGALALTNTPRRAAVWLDMADTNGVVVSENNYVRSLPNRGSTGGAFTAMNGFNNFPKVRIDTNYTDTAGLTMLDFLQADSTIKHGYDLRTWSFSSERPNAELNVFCVFAFAADGARAWTPPFWLAPENGSSNPRETEFIKRNDNFVGYVTPCDTRSNGSQTCDEYPFDFVPGELILGSIRIRPDGSRTRVLFERPGRSTVSEATRADNVCMSNHFNYGQVRIAARVTRGDNDVTPFVGAVGELIVFDQPMGEEEHQAIRAYLRDKWFARDPDAPVPALVSGARPAAALDVTADAALTVPAAGTRVGALAVADGATLTLAAAAPLDTAADTHTLLAFDSLAAPDGAFALVEALRPFWQPQVTAGAVAARKRKGTLILFR